MLLAHHCHPPCMRLTWDTLWMALLWPSLATTPSRQKQQRICWFIFSRNLIHVALKQHPWFGTSLDMRNNKKRRIEKQRKTHRNHRKADVQVLFRLAPLNHLLLLLHLSQWLRPLLEAPFLSCKWLQKSVNLGLDFHHFSLSCSRFFMVSVILVQVMLFREKNRPKS